MDVFCRNNNGNYELWENPPYTPSMPSDMDREYPEPLTVLDRYTFTLFSDNEDVPEETVMPIRIYIHPGKMINISRDELYDELIYEVQSKFPNETRHETALRYIRERENQASKEASETK